MARNFEEWMRQMERQVREARRSGIPIAIKYAQDAYNQANEELQQYKDLIPAAPIELTYQTALYTDRDGVVRGRLTIDFPDVVFSTTQAPIEVTHYELHGRAEGYGNVHSAYPGHLMPGQSYPGMPGSVLFSKAKLLPMQRVATSSTSSFTVNGITQGQTLRYRVRAAGGTFVRPGLWSQELVIFVEKDTTPPPQPTAPRVRISRGVILVDYDGQAVNGVMPADLDRVALAHGTSSSPTGEVHAFYREGGTYVLPGATYYDTQFFRLQAIDQSGNRGPWSEQATGMATPLVDEDVILSRIDAAETIIDNAGALILETGETLTGLLDQSRTDLADTQIRLSETQEKLNYTFPATVNLQFEEAKAAAALVAQEKADAAEAAAITAAALDATAKAEQAEADAALDASTKANQALADAKLDASNKATAAQQAAIDAAALDATAKAEQAEADAAAAAALDAQAKADQALADAKADAQAKADAAEQAAITAAAADATAKAEQAEADAAATAAADATAKANQAKLDAEAAAKAYADTQDGVISQAAEEARALAEKAEADALVAAGIASDKGKVWFQSAAPPAGITNAWAGSPHASESIQRLNGTEVRRNLFRANPSFDENMNLWSINNTLGVAATWDGTVSRDGKGSIKVTTDGSAAGRAFYNSSSVDRTKVTPGTTYTVGIWVKGTGGNVRLDLRQVVTSGTAPGDASGPTVALDGTWQLVQATFTASEFANEMYPIFRVPSAHAITAHVDSVIMEVGTEVGSYFDGGSPDDRSFDLWVGTDDQNRPYRWNSDTDAWVESSDLRVADAVSKAEQALIDAAAAEARAEAVKTEAAADATAKADAAEQAAKDAAALDATAKMEQAEADAAADAQAKANQALADAKADATAKADAAEQAAKNAAALDATAKMEQAEADAALDAAAKANQALADAKADATVKADEAERLAKEAAALDATAKAEQAEADAIAAASLDATAKANQAKADAQAAAEEYARQQDEPIRLAAEAAQGDADAAQAAADKALQSARSYINDGTSIAGLVFKQGGATTIISSATAMGGKAMEKTGALHKWLEDQGNIQAIDPNLLYRFTIRVRVVTAKTSTGGAGLYYGAVGLADDTGTVYVNSTGVNSYSSQQWATSNSQVPTTGAWVDYVTYYKGMSTGNKTGAGTLTDPAKFQVNTKYFCPGMILDYNNGNGVWEVSHWSVDAIDPVGHQALLDAAAAKTRADDAHTLAGTAESNAQTALTMAGGKSRVYYSANAPSGTGKTDDTWRQTDTNGDVIAEWRWTGAWTSQKITSQAISNLDVGKLTVGTGVISQLVAQHIAAESGEFIELDVSQLRSTAATIDTAVIDKLWADVVMSRKIGAQQIVVGEGGNVIPNGAGEKGDKTGFANGTSLTLDTVDKPAGVMGSFRSAPGSGTVTGSLEGEFSVVAGAEYVAEVWLKADKPDSRIYVELRNSAGLVGTYASVPGSALPSAHSSSRLVENHIVPTVWTKYETLVTMPADTGKVRVSSIYFNHANGTERTATQWVAFRLKERLAGSVIVDGAITTRKLTVTEDMTVTLLAAHKVEAGEIDTNSLTADTAFLGYLDARLIVADLFEGKAFTGGTFTGSTFQSNPEPTKGLKFTTAGLTAYDAAGLESFRVSSSTGAGKFAGRISTTAAGAGATLLPAAESSDGTSSGLFISKDGTLTGGVTAGAWVGKVTSTAPENLFLRGLNGGHVEVVEGTLYIRGAGQRVGNFANWALGDAGNGSNYLPNLWINPPGGSTGYLRITNAPTTSAGANALIAITPEGVVYRSTSSIRYKADVLDYTPTYEALNLRGRTWVDRCPIDDADPYRRYVGFIAEEVEAAGFPEFVTYDDFGEPDAVEYSKMPSPLVLNILRDMDRRMREAGI